MFTAPTERFDRQSNFDPVTGKIIMAGKSAPLGRDLATNDKNNFGPRIGFAYSGLRKNKKMVVRGGRCVVYNQGGCGRPALYAEPRNGAGNFPSPCSRQLAGDAPGCPPVG